MKDIILFGWFVVLLVITAAILVGSRYPASTAPTAPTAYVSSGKCDSPDTVATLKDIALRKINGAGRDYLVPFGRFGLGPHETRDKTDRFSVKNLSIDSFRKRGVIGEAGLNCAASVVVHAAEEGIRWFELSVDYTIETTTDGKTIVSARFSPNS